MADERHRTSSTGTTGTLEAEHEHHEHDANRDPLSGEPGAHPVGTGVGAATGGTVGAVVGGAVGGPVGAMVGAAVGGLAGGLAGKGIAESVNPTEEEAYWRESYASRPYASGRSFDEWHPAYQYGWESRARYADRSWNDVESDLERGWSQTRGASNLGWSEARHATRDAWDRIDTRYGRGSSNVDLHGTPGTGSGGDLGAGGGTAASGERIDNAYRGAAGTGWTAGGVGGVRSTDQVGTTSASGSAGGHTGTSDLRSPTGYGGFHPGVSSDRGTSPDAPATTGMGADLSGIGTVTANSGLATRWNEDEDRYWRENFGSRSYGSGRGYEDYRPAYQYGYESAGLSQGRRWEEAESDLERGWDRAKGNSKMMWHEVKDAVRDAWHRVERALPGDADRDRR